MNTGDRFLSELLETKPVADDTFRGERIFIPNSRSIYGGELMAQALVAAGKTVPDKHKVHSLHCYFHDRGNVLEPNNYCVTRFRDSSRFSHRLVEAHALTSDSGKAKPYFRMDCSFKKPEEDPASFVAPMPSVPGVGEIRNTNAFIESLDESSLPDVCRLRLKMFRSFHGSFPFEVAYCEPEYILGLQSNSAGRLHAWVRLKETPTKDIRPYRDAILAYISDAILLWVAITEPHHVTFLVTLNQSIWFHNPDRCPRPNEWLLFETRANYVGDALTHSYGAIWDAEGHLLASMAQQGLMRTQPITPQSSGNQLFEQGLQNNTATDNNNPVVTPTPE